MTLSDSQQSDVVITGQRAHLVQVIAAELDKPSVYMGGPSPRSRRIAEEVMCRLEHWGADAQTGRQERP